MGKYTDLGGPTTLILLMNKIFIYLHKCKQRKGGWCTRHLVLNIICGHTHQRQTWIRDGERTWRKLEKLCSWQVNQLNGILQCFSHNNIYRFFPQTTLKNYYVFFEAEFMAMLLFWMALYCTDVSKEVEYEYIRQLWLYFNLLKKGSSTSWGHLCSNGLELHIPSHLRFVSPSPAGTERFSPTDQRQQTLQISRLYLVTVPVTVYN